VPIPNSGTNNAGQISCNVSADRRSVNPNFQLVGGLLLINGWLQAVATMVQEEND
jgi:hypothetical protein